nr:hypothetical protein [Chryseobacterium sp. pc1-10]
MKIKASAVLFFVISCFHAQEITDTDGDGTTNKDDACPTVNGPVENNGCPWPDTDGDGIWDKDDACPMGNTNGCYDNNCSEVYKKEQQKLENFKIESKDVNFDKLTNKIVSGIDKGFYPDKKLIVLTSHVLAIESRVGDCRRENPALIYNDKNFWTIGTINQISVLLKKDISVGSAYQSFSSPDIDIEYNPDFGLKNVSKFAYKKKIKHLETLNKRKLGENPVDNYGMLMIRFTNDFGNIVKAEYTYTNLQAGKPFSKKEIDVTYQYISNDWKVIETKEEKRKVHED